MKIRNEKRGDEDTIRAVVTAAFGQPDEAGLVDRLRASGCDQISLVAACGESIIGHILYTPATIECDGQSWPAWGLAPMAVLPAHQRRHVGTALIARGQALCAASGIHRVIVLGHADYYPRFGFVPASKFGITSEYDVPDEVFMAMELEPGAFDAIEGAAKYRAEFGGL